MDCLLRAWPVAELCLGSVMTLLNPPNAFQIVLASWDVHALGVAIVCYGVCSMPRIDISKLDFGDLGVSWLGSMKFLVMVRVGGRRKMMSVVEC